jgi:hypothetical protein
MTTYVSQGPLSDEEADRYLTEARRVLGDITSGRWIEPGLAAGGGFASAGSTPRPIDQLQAAGLGWLESDFQRLQAVQDRMALRPAQIQAYADAWQKAADKISEISRMLSGCASEDTRTWCGVSGDRYRARAAGMAKALAAAATMATAKRAAAVAAAEVTADARRQVGEKLDSLAKWLISYLEKARAIHGGITVDDVTKAKEQIASCEPGIKDLESKLLDSIAELTATQYRSGRANPALLTDDMVPYLGAVGYWLSVLDRYLRGEPVWDALVPGRLRPLRPKPMQQLPVQQQQAKARGNPPGNPPGKPWPQRQNYPAGPKGDMDFGRDWHARMAELERAYEGKELVNGWKVTKVERALEGGNKRVDFMMINEKTKEIQIVDYYTGKSEPRSHIDKSWSYLREKEIEDLKKQGYKPLPPITGSPRNLQ